MACYGMKRVTGFGVSLDILVLRTIFSPNSWPCLKGCDKGCRRLICFSDSSLAIRLVTGPANNLHCYAVINQSIKDLLRQQWSVTLEHTLREGNSAADFLAKHGSSMESKWEVFKQPLVGMEEILNSDATRVPILRP